MFNALYVSGHNFSGLSERFVRDNGDTFYPMRRIKVLIHKYAWDENLIPYDKRVDVELNAYYMIENPNICYVCIVYSFFDQNMLMLPSKLVGFADSQTCNLYPDEFTTLERNFDWFREPEHKELRFWGESR